MTTLLWIVGYLVVGLVATVVAYRYDFDDYDRRHFPLPLGVVGWPIVLPTLACARRKADPLRMFIEWCARRLP